MKNYSPILRCTLYFLLSITLLLSACGDGSSSSSSGGSCADSLQIVVKNSQGVIMPNGGTYPPQNSLFFATVTILPNPGAGVDVEFRGTQFGGAVSIFRTDSSGKTTALPFRFGHVNPSGLSPRPSGSVETLTASSSCVSSEWIGTVQ